MKKGKKLNQLVEKAAGIISDKSEIFSDRLSDEQLAELAVLAAKAEHLPKAKELLTELVETTLRLRQTLNDYDDLILPFTSRTHEHIKTIRSTRMTMISEVASMTNALRDVRKFFLDKDYHEEIKRLREFVELCERLKVLKDSGFLDSIVDTMLKLDNK